MSVFKYLFSIFCLQPFTLLYIRPLFFCHFALTLPLGTLVFTYFYTDICILFPFHSDEAVEGESLVFCKLLFNFTVETILQWDLLNYRPIFHHRFLRQRNYERPAWAANNVKWTKHAQRVLCSLLPIGWTSEFRSQPIGSKGLGGAL